MSAFGDAASTIEVYLSEQKAIIDAFPVAVVAAAAEALFRTYDRGGRVYALGNGGNAGTLDHAYCDFRHHPFVSEDKTRPVPAHIPTTARIAITEHFPLFGGDELDGLFHRPRQGADDLGCVEVGSFGAIEIAEIADLGGELTADVIPQPLQLIAV